ncbi:MAG: transposase domain-containing protein [Brasilonema sp.]
MSSGCDRAIADSQTAEDRKRALPTHLMVCLLIGMSLWSKVSIRTVLKISRKQLICQISGSR